MKEQMMSAKIMTPLDDQELRELAELSGKASPGPWHVPRRDLPDDDSYIVLTANPAASEAVTIAHTRWPLTLLSPEPDKATLNAEFIARCRDAVPRLIAEVEQLRRQNRQLRAMGRHARLDLDAWLGV